MTVSAVESTPGILGSSAFTTTSPAGTADKDMFMQLLVAQMRYQDPANPTDSSAFLSQSAQFTALEKMQSVADQTAQLVSLQVTFGANAMVGKHVAYTGTDGKTATGVINSVRFEATGPVLQVNDHDIHLADILATGDGTTDLAAAAVMPPTQTPVGTGTQTGTPV